VRTASPVAIAALIFVLMISPYNSREVAEATPPHLVLSSCTTEETSPI
jgi:hypothetical protein